MATMFCNLVALVIPRESMTVEVAIISVLPSLICSGDETVFLEMNGICCSSSQQRSQKKERKEKIWGEKSATKTFVAVEQTCKSSAGHLGVWVCIPSIELKASFCFPMRFFMVPSFIFHSLNSCLLCTLFSIQSSSASSSSSSFSSLSSSSESCWRDWDEERKRGERRRRKTEQEMASQGCQKLQIILGNLLMRL